MPDSSADRDPLDRLAEEFVDRYRAGQRPALSEFILRQPDRADEIRELFPALVEMEQLKPVSGERTGDFAPVAEPSDPQRVGEFRILRRVGHGGMGVVYEAVQESLGRHVALKLMPLEALADPKRLERFRREAKAAARLHHTNIVPVFGTGEADGRHFYAMQFIDGHPLDAVIDEVRRLKDKSAPTLPRAVSEVAAAVLTGHFADPAVSAGLPAASTSSPALSGSLSDGGRHYWETVARLGAQAADALAYAHAQGVQHRDIKPSNLLLDLQGTVWVTDFGLAKATDTDDLTHSGDVVGTLRYLAPERFDGPGDHRSDVYSLGLTVYELLTLRPAFAADVRAKLVEQVVAASPPKPRSVSATIPRDLETVVLKATARDPAMRYASAAELADDLRRFVQDRPIQARRASAFEQTWRWCRRNPAVASLLAAVVLITAGGFATTAYQAAVAREEARRADENAAHAEERAEEVLREKRAQEALNQQLRSKQQELRRTLYAAHMNQAQSAWQGENYSRVLDLLEQHRPKADEPDLRNFEWHYWKRQAHKELAVFRLPSTLPTGLPVGTIVSTPLALSDDGARVASANASQGLQVWDVATGRRLTHRPDLKPLRASGPGSRLNNVNLLFSPDGRRVAIVVARGEEEDEDGLVAPSWVRIVFVEAEGGRELYHIDPNVRATGRVPYPMIMDFSPDGKLFAVGVSQVTGPRGVKAEPTTLAVHDLTAKARLFQVPRPALSGLVRLKFRPDGRQLEALGRNPDDRSSIRLVVDATTGKDLPDAPIDEGPAGTRSPDGRRTVTGTFNKGQRGVRASSTITVTADGKEVWKGQVSAAYTSFRFSPDGKRLVGYSNSRFGGFGGPGGNAGLRVWNADTGEVLPVHIVLSDPLVEVAFRPDGKLVTLDTGAVKTWDLAPPPMAPMGLSLAGPSSLTGGPAVTPDGRFCVSYFRRRGFGENPAEKIDEPEPAVLVLAEPGLEVLRVPMKGGNVVTFPSPPTALSADGSTLAIGGFSGARGMEKAVDEPPLMTLWDVVGKREIGRIASPAKENEAQGGRGPVAARRAGVQIAFSPDGRLVALTRGRGGAFQEAVPSTITVWDVATQKPRHTIEVKAGTAMSLAFSPDGRRIAVALISGSGPVFANDSAVVQVFDLASGGEVRKIDVPYFTFPGVKYSPDGKWLAVYGSSANARGRGRDSSPQLWPAERGREPVDLTGSAPLTRDLTFSPDAQRVAVLSSYLSGRSEVKVWDPPTGRELLSLPVDQPASAVRFSADGQALYVFTAGGRLTFDATALSPEVEASDVADRLSPAETRDEILAEIDRLALSKGLKARVAELARPVPFLRSRPTGPAFLSLQAGRPEGEYKAGLAQYEEQVKSRPKSSTPWGYLGMYRYRLGKFDEALEALVKAQELTTEAQRARTTVAGVSRLVFLAMAQQRLGRADEAKATLARAREVAKSIGSAPVLSLLKEADELVEPRK